MAPSQAQYGVGPTALMLTLLCLDALYSVGIAYIYLGIGSEQKEGFTFCRIWRKRTARVSCAAPCGPCALRRAAVGCEAAAGSAGG